MTPEMIAHNKSLAQAINIVEGRTTLTLDHKEFLAIEIAMRFLALYLKRDQITGLYCLQSGASLAVYSEQATAIERVLEKVSEA